MNRVCLIVLDSVGIGELPDANLYKDEGSHTLGNTYNFRKQIGKDLNIPNLYKMGLGNIQSSNLPHVDNPSAAFCRLAEKTAAKDTTCGHWEMLGLSLEVPFKTFPDAFPPEIINKFENAIGRKVIGNEVASGTEIIERLGKQHVETGYPIIYTSADSVFQIAAHEDVISIDELYNMCRIAFDMLKGDWSVGRVIARPFKGTDTFTRTENRKDFATKPPKDTVLDALVANNIHVHAIGKIEDIFANCGISSSDHTTNNKAGIDSTIKSLIEQDSGLIFTNLVDFDMIYGHRNNPDGYADALEYFDARLPEITGHLKDGDMLIITADHGCDPTTPSTDHSREYVPCLVYGKNVKPKDLGTRDSFADIGATVYEFFGLGKWREGKSFLKEIL